MSKVYGIICDRNYNHILVGLGGTVGNPPALRRGWHLPGGTINNTGNTDPVHIDNRITALVGEIGEEFGRFRGFQLERFIRNRNILVHHGVILDGHAVYFNIYNLNVDGAGLRAYEGDVRDGQINVNDSSFSRVNVVGLEDAMDEFRGNAMTGWFAYGCKYTLGLRDM